MPVGSTGSLLLGCHAYPLSVECSVRPDGAKTEEFIKKIKIYKKKCMCVVVGVCKGLPVTLTPGTALKVCGSTL